MSKSTLKITKINSVNHHQQIGASIDVYEDRRVTDDEDRGVLRCRGREACGRQYRVEEEEEGEGDDPRSDCTRRQHNDRHLSVTVMRVARRLVTGDADSCQFSPRLYDGWSLTTAPSSSLILFPSSFFSLNSLRC